MPTYYRVHNLTPAGSPAIATPQDLHENGSVCGYYGTDAFTYRNGVFTARTLGNPGGANSINAAGDIAGAFFDVTAHLPEEANRAYVWPHEASALINLQSLIAAAEFTNTASISDTRIVCADYQPFPPDYDPKPFLYKIDTAELVLLSGLGHAMFTADAINNANQITGVASYPNNGYVYDFVDDVYTSLTFGGVDINDAGVVIGNRDRATPMRFIGGHEEPLPNSGGDLCEVRGIDAAGRVAGIANNEDPNYYFGFVIEGDQLYDLNDYIVTSDPWQIYAANDLNSSGSVICLAKLPGDPQNLTYGLLLTPTVAPFDVDQIAAIVTLIFGGVIFGGSGFGFIGGKFHRIPSNNPEDVRRMWENLNAQQREVLVGLALTRLDGVVGKKHEDAVKKVASEMIIDAARQLAAGPAAQQKASSPRTRARVQLTEAERHTTLRRRRSPRKKT